MAVPSWIYDILCPLLGVIICTTMFLSPIVVIRKAISNKDLGDLNPLPWLAIIFNCFGGALYGCMRRNFFIFWSNFPGLLSGIYCVHSAIKILSSQSECQSSARKLKLIEGVFYAVVVFWGLVSMIISLILGTSRSQREIAAFMVGAICCFTALTYYIAPLIAMFHIIRIRNSSSLYPPTVIANFTNSLLWFIYGSVLMDPLIWIPNVVSLVLTIAQILLCVIYWPYDINQIMIYKHTLLGNTPRSTSDDAKDTTANDVPDGGESEVDIQDSC